MRKRERVSSQDLYQSISVLRAYGFEKDLFERHGQNVYGLGLQRACFGDDALLAVAGEHRQHSPLLASRDDAARLERSVRRVALEHELDALVAGAHLVERTVDDDAAA